MYDTKTARWLVQDPLAEKYYPFSSYNYCVNNPVRYVDPDGREVIIGTRVGRFLASLGINNYVKQVQRYINELRNISPVLNTVITEIEQSVFTIKIRHTDEKPKEPNKKSNDGNAFVGSESNVGRHKSIPSGGTIFYDPNNYKTAKGNYRKPIIGLSHELGHAENQIKGQYVVYKTHNKTKEETIRDEQRSMELENIIRGILKENTRKSYF